jgi:hypothetical protein
MEELRNGSQRLTPASLEQRSHQRKKTQRPISRNAATTQRKIALKGHGQAHAALGRKGEKLEAKPRIKGSKGQKDVELSFSIT